MKMTTETMYFRFSAKQALYKYQCYFSITNILPQFY